MFSSEFNYLYTAITDILDRRSTLICIKLTGSTATINDRNNSLERSRRRIARQFRRRWLAIRFIELSIVYNV